MIMVKNMDDKKSLFKKIIIIIFIIIIIITGLVLYSRYIATTGLIVKEYKITSEKLTDNFHGLKIVHLSDLHYGSTFDEKDLEKVVEKIKIIKPDIVVLTGDLFDTRFKLNDDQKQTIIKNLSKIDVTIGKYAIAGEQDTDEDWEKIIKESGFINLNNDYTSIYNSGSNYIFMAGISSNLNDDEKITKIDNYLNTLTDDNKPIYNILLLHEPDYITEIDYTKYDLVLAGHSHGGGIRLPFIGAIFLEEGAKKYHDEYYKLGNTDLYISSGLGTSNIDLRFLNKPSFNFYRLTNK